jgi:hypothetical protein
MTEFRITLTSDDPAGLDEAIKHLQAGAEPRELISCATVQIVHRRAALGFSGSEIAVDLAVKIVSGVATKVIADWICTAIAQRRVKIEVDGKPVDASAASVDRALRAAAIS